MINTFLAGLGAGVFIGSVLMGSIINYYDRKFARWLTKHRMRTTQFNGDK